MSNDPKPRSPERIVVLPDISARYEEGRGTLVTFTVRYEEWCCAEAHELTDAIATVIETLEDAALKAQKKRMKKINKRVMEALSEDATRREGPEQLTLFDNL